ncbi:MAG: hypothetical protein J7L15_01105 [Clostridiales bacterium]|nr:hypothetical protein [Clostridiales bacterium]
MRFKKYNEAFDKPYKLKLNKDSDSNKEYQFVTDQDKKYYIKFKYTEGELAAWDLSFSTSAGSELINKSGDAFRIFATVLDAMKKHKKEIIEQGIKFGADLKEPSRIKLYDVMAKQIKKEFKFKNLTTKKMEYYKYYKLDNK